MQVELDKVQLDRIQAAFEIMPKQMKRSLRNTWNREGTKIKKHIQKSVLSGPTGARSVGRGPGIRTDKGFYGMKRKHLKQDIRRTVKVSPARAKNFGAFLRVGYSSASGLGRKPTDAGYIGFFHEYGTDNMPARKLIETAWNNYPGGESSIFKATDKAIDEVTSKF